MKPFAESVLPNLIGVVDLKAGQCVHAIRGERTNYRPLSRSFRDPTKLIGHYHRLGLRSIYIADLDSLGGKSIQLQTIEKGLLPFDNLECIFVDLGLKDAQDASRLDDALRLVDRYPTITIVLASESVRNLKSLKEFAERIGPDRVALGLDYHAERFKTIDTSTKERDWLGEAHRIGIRQTVIIDTARVGTASGPNLATICRRTSAAFPDHCITAGGGIRNTDDVEKLRQCGCNRFLVATALFPSQSRSPG